MGDVTLSTLRHGDTDFNHQKRYAGLLDVPLNGKGVRDTVAAATLLGVEYDVVVSSSLQRALETARILVGEAHEIVQTDLCNERNFGRMQGLTADETETLKPTIRYVRVGGDFHSLDPPAGETLPALRKRAAGFAGYLARDLRGSSMLVVSHEVFLLQLHGFLRGETWQEAMGYRLPNLTLHTFTLRDGRLLGEVSRPLVPTPREGDDSFFVR